MMHGTMPTNTLSGRARATPVPTWAIVNNLANDAGVWGGMIPAVVPENFF